MNEDRGVEDRLIRALHATAVDIPTRTTRPLDLGAPLHQSAAQPLRRWAPALFAAAAVGAIVATVILFQPRSTPRTDAAADQRPGQTELTDGLRITLPEALTLRRLDEQSPGPFIRYCAASSGNFDADCSDGIEIRVASRDGFVPGGPDHTCKSGEPTIPTLAGSTLGGLKAELWTIHCGSSSLATHYWELASGKLSIQAPIDGSLALEAQQLTDSLDTGAWVHSTATAPLAESTSAN